MAKNPIKKKSIKDYKTELKTIQKFFNLKFDARHTLTPARKRLITIYYNSLPNLENTEFIPAKKSQIKTLGAASTHKTNKGFFMQKKAGASKTKIKKEKIKNAVFSPLATSYKVNKHTFKTYAIKNPAYFALDPDGWIKTLPNYSKAKKFFINVGDLKNRSNFSYTAGLFNRYLINLTGRNGENMAEFVTGVTLVF